MSIFLLPKIITIVGPTAAGKTALGIALARTFNGEIVSADSRQVYKKMDIGTAKPVGTWIEVEGSRIYSVEGIPHHMVDIVDPGDEFSLAHFKERALVYIYDILKRGRIPIVVGGTGLYIWSILDNLSLPRIPPHKKLRESLNVKTTFELKNLLEQLDPEAVKNTDVHNPRRLIRALEVIILSGQPLSKQRKKGAQLFSTLQIGVKTNKEILTRNIDTRIDEQLHRGLVEEVEALMRQKYGWRLPSMSSLGYRQIGSYLKGEMNLEEAVARLKRDTRQYARRQMTWFKRDDRIVWKEPEKIEEIKKLIIDFLQ